MIKSVTIPAKFKIINYNQYFQDLIAQRGISYQKMLRKPIVSAVWFM